MNCPLCQQVCECYPFPVAEGLRYSCKCLHGKPITAKLEDQTDRFVYGTFKDGSVRYFSIRELPVVFHYAPEHGWFVYTAQNPITLQQTIAEGHEFIPPEQAHKLLLQYKGLLLFS